MKPPVINGVPMRKRGEDDFELNGVRLLKDTDVHGVWFYWQVDNRPGFGEADVCDTLEEAAGNIESAIARIREAAAKLGT